MAFDRKVSLKKQLSSGKATIGSWITVGNSATAEIMARAGYDWLAIDLEHSVIAIDTAGDLIRIIDLCGVTPLVRLTSNQPDQIKRVMDAGAHGIIVPSVNSAKDAERAVSAVSYAPAGNRGVGLARAQGYGSSFKEYLKWQRSNSVVVVMIEHKDAVANLKGILKVPGVDAFFIGPYDLSCSIGLPGQFKHPDFLAMMAKIRRVGADLGVPGGLHVVEPDLGLLKTSVQEGYRFIAYSVDMRILDVGIRQGASAFRKWVK